jgi:Ala-tRNA(Pro) deacylase
MTNQSAACPVTRAELFQRFDELGIATRTIEHEPLYTVAESQAARQDLPGGHCKNLFLKDKKGALYLVVVLEDRDVPIQKLAKHIGAARLSFGRAELLFSVMGVEPGSVTPFALINDCDQRLAVVLDQEMLAHDLLNYHPLRNDATTALKSADLLRFIEACGHRPRIVNFAALGESG